MHPHPVGLGRRPSLHTELEALGDPSLTPARVLAQHRGAWLIRAPEPESGPEFGSGPAAVPRLAVARGRLRDDDDGLGSPVTGDWVAVDAAGAICAVLPRTGSIVRRAPGEGPARGQVLAANVDLALVAEPLPAPNERRAERLAALASAGGVPAALVLTKADLADDGGFGEAARVARRLGLADAVAVSAADGDVGVLRTLLASGTTAVLLGPSGAGKSTLVNALLGDDVQATGDVRASDGRGRHTTVARELIALPGGALLIDTPGVREAGVWDGTGATFADVDALAAECRFADCTHAGEPGCAVAGTVPPDRLEAWRKLAREQAWVDDRRAASRAREERGKQYARWQKEAQRLKGRPD